MKRSLSLSLSLSLQSQFNLSAREGWLIIILCAGGRRNNISIDVYVSRVLRVLRGQWPRATAESIHDENDVGRFIFDDDMCN